MTFIKLVFWISVFMIIWANIGYPLFILILGKILKKKNSKMLNYEPSVTIMIVAHNEEKVIEEKLNNVLKLSYPAEKLSILVTSDNSTDLTNEIVEKYVQDYKNITLYKVKGRKGKTNAQNEAARLVNSEILVMTDANAMLDKNAISELVSSFTENVAYVAGKLVYINSNNSLTSQSETKYWDLDTRIREIESDIQTITAGNGALYAIRTLEYVDFDPLMSHDSMMPLYYALNGKRAIANHKALVYEKAGENNKDEFNRKVRMSRITLKFILPSLSILNILKYKWFTIFYLGHRTSRYLLWFNHIVTYLINVFLISHGFIYLLTFLVQNIIYLLAFGKFYLNINNKFTNVISYYCMTILAQLIGVVKTILRKNKPFWEKAESTR
ncbi:glycosyltransferase family 2 protein [Streptococcus porcinus]|uniref:Glycosyltransferase family 2 protein n=1 Tax=Streptococcus porcinus TaxID=1340 RepID=A0A7W0ARW3_STRPO|nr:glycosyltransferase family 2 protein [Streptococcus porcinus]MBA2796623.1 glycosyltransferase family 2 protein [Streptococcus porcinus]